MTDWLDGAAAAAPDRAAALTLVPQGPRLRCLALLALGHELDRAARASAQPMLNEIRLQWWVEALARLPDGAGQHPLLAVLAECSPGEGAALSQLAEGWRLRCDPAEMQTSDAARTALAASSGALVWMAARALGAGAGAEAAARAQGIALGAAALLARGPSPAVSEAGRAAAAEAAQGVRTVRRAVAPALYGGPLARWRLGLEADEPGALARRAALLRFAVTRDWRIGRAR